MGCPLAIAFPGSPSSEGSDSEVRDALQGAPSQPAASPVGHEAGIHPSDPTRGCGAATSRQDCDRAHAGLSPDQPLRRLFRSGGSARAACLRLSSAGPPTDRWRERFSSQRSDSADLGWIRERNAADSKRSIGQLSDRCNGAGHCHGGRPPPGGGVGQAWKREELEARRAGSARQRHGARDRRDCFAHAHRITDRQADADPDPKAYGKPDPNTKANIITFRHTRADRYTSDLWVTHHARRDRLAGEPRVQRSDVILDAVPDWAREHPRARQ